MVSKNDISTILRGATEYKTLRRNMRGGLFPQAVFGVEYGSFILNIIALYRDLGKLVVIVENEAVARQLQDDLIGQIDNIYLFDKLEMTFFDAYSHSHQLENARLNTLYHLLEEDNGLFIMPVDSMFVPLNDPLHYLNERLSFAVGDTVERERFIETLVNYGYSAEPIVEATGQFALRGGIVDVLPPLAEQPLRIEFFGDEIDSMRRYDMTTLRSIENISQATIRPCREGLLFGDQLDLAIERNQARLKATKNGERRRLLSKLIEELKEGVHIDLRYQLLPLCLSEMHAIFDYIGDVVTVYWHYNRIVERNRARYGDWLERFKQHLEKGEALAEQVELMLQPEVWLNAVAKSNALIFSGLKTPLQYIKLKSIVDYHFREAANYHQHFDLVKADIGHWLSSGYRIYILLASAERLTAVQKMLADGGFESKIVTAERDIPGIYLVKQAFPSGFTTETFKVVVLTERELFGRRHQAKRRRVKHARSIKSFTDLAVGDYVVHDTHGIGKYRGVFQLTVDGQKKDFLKISYKTDDVLYVPVEKMETLQKYIGADVSKVRLSKLGGTEWSKTKQRVKKSVEDMTDQLISLYAERKAQKGYAFSADGPWQHQFEDDFPYEETDDQLKCIAEIKRDMEAAKPMDRLLCGDVGYG
ncbi:MAG: hypothetical protein CSA13_01670 [Clostridiales bacterium]|nr:MAG: hypothetical protein CSA13_01670 [Clostridiales bacterium]